MQKLLFLSLALAPSMASAQTALKVGDPLPDFVLPRVVNSKTGTFAPAAAQGKVLVLEFWGTYCSPCIPALRRLDALQQRYPNDLQVVGISTDSEARLHKFLTKWPLTVPLASASDDQQDINRLFPHQSISHTVVVDKNRRVVAITFPEQFDEKALHEVVAGRPIHLKLKQDVRSDDAMGYFAVDSTTRYGVNVRPYIQGLSSQTKNPRKGPFAQRRLTAINTDPVSLFQEAYGITRWRIQNQLPDSLRQYDDLNLLCFDLIVPRGRKPTCTPSCARRSGSTCLCKLPGCRLPSRCWYCGASNPGQRCPSLPSHNSLAWEAANSAWKAACWPRYATTWKVSCASRWRTKPA